MKVNLGTVSTALGLLLIFGGLAAWVTRAEMEHDHQDEQIEEIHKVLEKTVDNQRNIEKILDRQVAIDEERQRWRESNKPRSNGEEESERSR